MDKLKLKTLVRAINAIKATKQLTQKEKIQVVEELKKGVRQ